VSVNVVGPVTTTCHGPFAAVLPATPAIATRAPDASQCARAVVTSIGVAGVASVIACAAAVHCRASGAASVVTVAGGGASSAVSCV
jgi:hypothetical protein